MSEFLKRWGIRAGVVIAILLVLKVMLDHGFFHLPLSNVVVHPDPAQEIKVEPKRVTFTPKPSKENPHPTPEVIKKPIEGRVEFIPSVVPGETPALKVQEFGFTFEPKVGAVWNRGGFNYFLGPRVFFAGEWGLELGALLKTDGTQPQMAVGVDRRLPLFSNVTASAGIAYDLSVFSPYVGAEVVLFNL